MFLYPRSMPYNCFTYILTNTWNSVLYVGVSSNFIPRLVKHRIGIGSAFTRKYNVWKLVYYEQSNDIRAVISREKQIKNMNRRRKVQLVNGFNPQWKDLAEELDADWNSPGASLPEI